MVGVWAMGDLIKWFGSYTTGLILAPCAFLYVLSTTRSLFEGPLVCANTYHMGSAALFLLLSTVRKVHVSC